MGKHSKEKKKINFKKSLLAIFIVVILIWGINFILSHRDIVEKQEKIETAKTIEGQKLVIKSNSDYNRIIEYGFENNLLKTIKIYEQFEQKEQFDTKKSNYEKIEDIIIINADEKNLILEIENKDFGTDEGLSYEQIYDKYLIQIIGAYQIIQ